MNLFVMVQSVIMMGSMLGIGALLTKKVRFHEDTRGLLTTLIVYVAVPSMVLASFLQLPQDNGLYLQLIIAFLYSVSIYIITAGITWWTARFFGVPKLRASQMAIISAQGNIGFIGVPLCMTLFGSKATILGAMFDTGVGVCLWTIGTMLLQNRTSFSLRTLKPLLNFPLMAIVLGLVFSITKWQLPETVDQLLLKLGALASPLALIYIGFFMPKLMKERTQISYSHLGFAIGMKLIFVPLLMIGSLSLLNFDHLMKQVLLLMSTMPTGMMVPILFAAYKSDEEFGARATLYATLISLLTIPLMYSLGSWILHL